MDVCGNTAHTRPDAPVTKHNNIWLCACVYAHVREQSECETKEDRSGVSDLLRYEGPANALILVAAGQVLPNLLPS